MVCVCVDFIHPPLGMRVIGSFLHLQAFSPLFSAHDKGNFFFAKLKVFGFFSPYMLFTPTLYSNGVSFYVRTIFRAEKKKPFLMIKIEFPLYMRFDIFSEWMEVDFFVLLNIRFNEMLIAPQWKVFSYLYKSFIFIYQRKFERWILYILFEQIEIQLCGF